MMCVPQDTSGSSRSRSPTTKTRFANGEIGSTAGADRPMCAMLSRHASITSAASTEIVESASSWRSRAMVSRPFTVRTPSPNLGGLRLPNAIEACAESFYLRESVPRTSDSPGTTLPSLHARCQRIATNPLTTCRWGADSATPDLAQRRTVQSQCGRHNQRSRVRSQTTQVVLLGPLVPFILTDMPPPRPIVLGWTIHEPPSSLDAMDWI